MRGLLSFLPWSRSARDWFVVDVGSSAVKIAEVTDGRDGREVLRAGCLPVPRGAVENGFVRRADVLGDAIREFAGPARGKPRQAVVSIPGRGVIIKRVQVPAQPVERLDRVIEFEAMDAIPEELDAVNLDHHVIGPSDDGKELEVLLVAARKTLVESYVALLDAAGLVPAVVDVDYFALRSGSGRFREQGADVLVHVGARSTTLHIPAGGPPGHTTDLPLGGEQFTESLAENLRVSRDEAEDLKRGGDPSPEVTGLLDSLCEPFAAQVRPRLQSAGRAGGRGPDRIVLSGGSALLPGLGPGLARVLDAEVRVYRPFFAGRGLPSPGAERPGPAFAVVAGLAARSPSE